MTRKAFKIGSIPLLESNFEFRIRVETNQGSKRLADQQIAVSSIHVESIEDLEEQILLVKKLYPDQKIIVTLIYEERTRVPIEEKR